MRWRCGRKGPQPCSKGVLWGRGAGNSMRRGGTDRGRSWQQSSKKVPNLEAPLSAVFPKLPHTELWVVWRITSMVQGEF